MKAAFIKKTGSSSVIEWGELPDPKVGEGELLIRTIAVAANPVDAYIRSGKFALTPRLKTPHILGVDLVGEVVHVGKNVKTYTAGMMVWSNSFGGPIDGQGSHAEFVVRKADYCFPLPKNANPIEAVAVLQSAATACRGFIVGASLRKDDVLFIHGAAGNVGTSMIQLAKARGAKVVAATTGKEKLAWCKKQGADVVLDYKKDNLVNGIKKIAPKGIDVFWDTSREPDFSLGLKLIKKGGRIVVASGKNDLKFPVNDFYQKEAILHGFSLFHATPEELAGYSLIINRALEENILKPKIAYVLSLSEAKKAHDLLEQKGGVWGRIVLVADNKEPKETKAKKSPAKKSAVKKAPAKKAAPVKKTEAKKTVPAKKVAVKKPAAKKTK